VIAAYLGEAFETGDSAFIVHAIRTLVRARGMDDMARKLGLSRSLHSVPRKAAAGKRARKK
jgi:probable addiction module antidote protein